MRRSTKAISEYPYIEAFYKLTKRDPDILCVTCSSLALSAFERASHRTSQGVIALPDGISAAIGFCAGLAREGYRPFLHASAASLSTNAMELLLSQISYPALPVRIIGFTPGLMHEGGVTGQALHDLAIF